MALLSASGFDRDRLTWAVAVVAPLVCVQIVRVLDGGMSQAPAAAPPVTVAAAPISPVPVVKLLTPQQMAAMQFLQTDGPGITVSSPMNHPRPAPTPPLSAPTLPAQGPDPVTTLTVTAIMGTEHQAVASISHTLRRVGDEVAPGWRVSEINARNRTVELKHTDGRIMTLRPAI